MKRRTTSAANTPMRAIAQTPPTDAVTLRSRQIREGRLGSDSANKEQIMEADDSLVYMFDTHQDAAQPPSELRASRAWKEAA